MKHYPKTWELPNFTTTIFHKKTTKYCICIPVINEGKKIQQQLAMMKPYTKLVDIIIADGGSTDKSLPKDVLKKNNIRALLIKKSAGKQGTQLRMGFAFALQEGYEGIITVDGNGKDDISATPAFIEALDKGYDFIQGSRFVKGGKAVNTPKSRYVGIRLIHAPLLSIASRFWYTDTTNGFRAFSKKYLLHPKVKPFRDIFSGYELLFYLNIRAPQLRLKVKEIPVTRSYPKGQIPTKIHGMRGNIAMIQTLLQVTLGKYHPAK